jgi:hypothetical protein
MNQVVIPSVVRRLMENIHAKTGATFQVSPLLTHLT